MIKKYIRLIYFILIYLIPIIIKLKKNNIMRINIFKIKRWHHGFAYFTGIYYSKEVFIKVDTKLNIMKNDKLVYDLCNDDLGEYLIEILHYSLDSKIQFIVFKYFHGKELTLNILLKNIPLVNKIMEILNVLNKHKIIHRDIKLNNFLIENDKLKIIDFSFAISSINVQFKELELTKRNNLKILKTLGDNLIPSCFNWDDYYSLNLIIKQILSQKKLHNCSNHGLHDYIRKTQQMIGRNVYSI